METDAELLARYNNASNEHQKALKRLRRARASSTRQRLARWAGCLQFVILVIRELVEERGLPLPPLSPDLP